LDGAGNLFIVDYGSGSVLEVPAGGGSRLPWSRDYAAAWASDDPIASAFLAIAYENAGSAGEGGGSAPACPDAAGRVAHIPPSRLRTRYARGCGPDRSQTVGPELRWDARLAPNVIDSAEQAKSTGFEIDIAYTQRWSRMRGITRNCDCDTAAMPAQRQDFVHRGPQSPNVVSFARRFVRVAPEGQARHRSRGLTVPAEL